MTRTSIFYRTILLGVVVLFAGSMLLGRATPAPAETVSMSCQDSPPPSFCPGGMSDLIMIGVAPNGCSHIYGCTTYLPITGYAWSDYLGWIHFNGSNYGVYENPSNGALSGYAWSPYLGWINFDDAQVNISTGAVTGWAQACAAFADKSICSGALDTGSGGWDGKIHLSGSNYGVTQSKSGATNGCWAGYAYGDTNIGVIKFGGASSNNVCASVCPNGANNPPTCDTYTVPFCGQPPMPDCPQGLSCIQVMPAPKTYTSNATFNSDGATYLYAGSCLSCSNGDVNPPDCTVNALGKCSNNDINPPLCTVNKSNKCSNGGTNPAACDIPSSCPAGTTNPPDCNLDTNGDCLNGANNPLTCDTFSAPTVSLTADPDTIDVGQSTVLSWISSPGTLSCVSSGGFNTQDATFGSAPIAACSTTTEILCQTANFGITCTGIGNSQTSAVKTVTVLQPTISISANPTRVASGSGTAISWTSSQVTSCAVTKNGVAWKTGLSSSGTPDSAVTTQTTYKLTCQTKGNPISKSTIVNVMPAFQEF